MIISTSGPFPTAGRSLAIAARAAQQYDDDELRAVALGYRAFHATEMHGTLGPGEEAACMRLLESSRKHAADAARPWLSVESRRCMSTVLAGRTPVRYMSADAATQRSTALRDDTRGQIKTARVAAFPQLAGRFRRMWQVVELWHVFGTQRVSSHGRLARETVLPVLRNYTGQMPGLADCGYEGACSHAIRTQATHVKAAVKTSLNHLTTRKMWPWAVRSSGRTTHRSILMPKSIANGVADCRRSRHRDAGKRAALAAAQSWRVSMNTGNCRVVLAWCSPRVGYSATSLGHSSARAAPASSSARTVKV